MGSNWRSWAERGSRPCRRWLSFILQSSGWLLVRLQASSVYGCRETLGLLALVLDLIDHSAMARNASISAGYLRSVKYSVNCKHKGVVRIGTLSKRWNIPMKCSDIKETRSYLSSSAAFASAITHVSIGDTPLLRSPLLDRRMLGSKAMISYALRYPLGVDDLGCCRYVGEDIFESCIVQEDRLAFWKSKRLLVLVSSGLVLLCASIANIALESCLCRSVSSAIDRL